VTGGAARVARDPWCPGPLAPFFFLARAVSMSVSELKPGVHRVCVCVHGSGGGRGRRRLVRQQITASGGDGNGVRVVGGGQALLTIEEVEGGCGSTGGGWQRGGATVRRGRQWCRLGRGWWRGSTEEERPMV
jgi:hypothetical protein